MKKSVPKVMQRVKFYVLFVVLFNPNFGVLLHRTRAVPEVKTLVVCSSFCGSFVIHFCNNLEEMNLTGSFSHQNFS